MNLEYICEQMVRILHGNITCISKSGAIEACYGDMAAQCNPLFTDPEFLSAVDVQLRTSEHRSMYSLRTSEHRSMYTTYV